MARLLLGSSRGAERNAAIIEGVATARELARLKIDALEQEALSDDLSSISSKLVSAREAILELRELQVG